MQYNTMKYTTIQNHNPLVIAFNNQGWKGFCANGEFLFSLRRMRGDLLEEQKGLRKNSFSNYAKVDTFGRVESHNRWCTLCRLSLRVKVTQFLASTTCLQAGRRYHLLLAHVHARMTQSIVFTTRLIIKLLAIGDSVTFSQGRPEDSRAPIQLLIAGPLWAEYADAMFSRYAFL